MSRTTWVKVLVAAAGLGVMAAGAAGGALGLASEGSLRKADIRTAEARPSVILAGNDTPGKQDAPKPRSQPRPQTREDGSGTDRLVNGARIGAWVVSCEAVAVGETVCALTQQLLRPSDRAFIADIIAAWNGETAVLIARVPLGAHLPSGFVLQAGDGKQRNFQWQRCFGRFCEAAFTPSPEDIAQLEASDEVIAAFRPTPASAPFPFRFSMKGLSQGLLALGADPASVSAAKQGGGETRKN